MVASMNTQTRSPFPLMGMVWFLVVMLTLSGCSSTPSDGKKGTSSSRYSMDRDAGPDGDFDSSKLVDPVPRYEPYSRGGNRSPYTVWGKSYTVMASAEGYRERGKASWYGAKFHGHRTSNGEVFNMYALSAAHRSLPLPSYVRVTNLDNGKSIIVRVNDRGPFHSGRIIDLSYAAAHKLGFSNRGTAHVEVEAIVVPPPGGKAPALVADRAVAAQAKPPSIPGIGQAAASDVPVALFVQVGAFSTAEAARQLSERVRSVTQAPVRVVSAEEGDRWHRVRVGPFTDPAEAESHRQLIENQQLGRPIVVTRPQGS